MQLVEERDKAHDQRSPDDITTRRSTSSLIRKVFTLTYVERGLIRRFRLGSTPTEIGRSRTCEVRINSGEVAPVQCRLEHTDDGALILFAEDDRFPVYVNGEPAQFKRLEGGEAILLGMTTLQVSSSIGWGPLPGAVRRDIAFEQDFNAQLRKSIKKAPWFLVSLVINAILVGIAALLTQEKEPLAIEMAGFFQNGFADSDSAFPLDEGSLDSLDDLVFDEPEDPEYEAPIISENTEPMIGEEWEDLQLDLWGSKGQGGEAFEAAGSMRLGERLLSGGSDGLFRRGTPWGNRRDGLLSSGFEVAILFDSTGSMIQLLQEVKTKIREMVKALDRTVPANRVALVTYKGDPASSRYVVAHTPLVHDIFELLNFMNSVNISGGSSKGYAAVAEALEATVRELRWRNDTEKAIVIMGDAAPFPKTYSRAVGHIRSFQGKVHTFFIRSDQTVSDLKLEAATVTSFNNFAMSSGGDFLEYSTEQQDLARRIITAAFGQRWKSDIDRIFAYEDRGGWRKVLEHRIEKGDMQWLMKQFMSRTARPEAIDALVDQGKTQKEGRGVAARVWKILQQDRNPSWLHQRCLYVLDRLAELQTDYMATPRDHLNRGQRRYFESFLAVKYGRDFPN